MRSARAGTIVWGAVLLVFAAIAFSVAVFDLREFQAAAVAWVVTGLGGVLVLATIVALIARAVSNGPAPVTAAEPTPVVEPVETPKPKTRATKGQPVD
jgi:hypothetical protein